MDRQFPSPPQLQENYCFLSPFDEQQRILVDLNSSLIFHRLPATQLPEAAQLQTDLAERYGGRAQDWTFSTIHGGYLLRISNWVQHHDILMDSYWEEKGLYVGPWQAVDASAELPRETRVLLTIKDFPLDFWHPFYFRQATTSMGVLMGFSNDRRKVEDKTDLKQLLDCYDLKLIPFKLFVGHAGRWSGCEITIEGREPLGDDGPPPPPPKPGNPRQRVFIPPMNLQLLYQLLPTAVEGSGAILTPAIPGQASWHRTGGPNRGIV